MLKKNVVTDYVKRPVLPQSVPGPSVTPKPRLESKQDDDQKSIVFPTPTPSASPQAVQELCTFMVEQHKTQLQSRDMVRTSSGIRGAAPYKRLTNTIDAVVIGVNSSSTTYKYGDAHNCGLDLSYCPAFGATGLVAEETRSGDFIWIKHVEYDVGLISWYQNATGTYNQVAQAYPTFRITLFEDKMPLLNNWQSTSPYFTEAAGPIPWISNKAQGDPDDPTTDDMGVLFSYASSNTNKIPRSTWLHVRSRETAQRFHILQDHVVVTPPTAIALNASTALSPTQTVTFKIKHTFPGRGHRIQFADNSTAAAVSGFSMVNSAIYLTITSDADYSSSAQEFDAAVSINGFTYFSDLGAKD